MSSVFREEILKVKTIKHTIHILGIFREVLIVVATVMLTLKKKCFSSLSVCSQ
jgi:hypothetical protein